MMCGMRDSCDAQATARTSQTRASVSSKRRSETKPYLSGLHRHVSSTGHDADTTAHADAQRAELVTDLLRELPAGGQDDTEHAVRVNRQRLKNGQDECSRLHSGARRHSDELQSGGGERRLTRGYRALTLHLCCRYATAPRPCQQCENAQR
jgi:hypothetical protein